MKILLGNKKHLQIIGRAKRIKSEKNDTLIIDYDTQKQNVEHDREIANLEKE